MTIAIPLQLIFKNITILFQAIQIIVYLQENITYRIVNMHIDF